MEQTPAHENANITVLELLPFNSMRVMEIGCGSGALAREFKIINPACHYIGLDVIEDYLSMAARHCDYKAEWLRIRRLKVERKE